MGDPFLRRAAVWLARACRGCGRLRQACRPASWTTYPKNPTAVERQCTPHRDVGAYDREYRARRLEYELADARPVNVLATVEGATGSILVIAWP